MPSVPRAKPQPAAPVDPRLAEFVEALARCLLADYKRTLAAEKQPEPESHDVADSR